MRIVREDLEFDEIACNQHIRQLEKFADDNVDAIAWAY